jgi:hypothetical protein
MLRQAVFLIALAILSGSPLAQGRLPFTGTRTFCGIEVKGTTAVVSIGDDRFTTVKTNMWTDRGSYVTFSGKLNAKGILRRNRDFFLLVKSETDIVMSAPQDYITGKLCR